MKQEMQEVFDACITKALIRINKKGNTDKPWDDCSIHHLEKRLFDEVEEYFDNPSCNELIDIINLACFCYLARINQLAETINYDF